MAKEADFAAMRLLVDLLADKWTLPVLGALCENGGCQRFNALRRGISDISQKSLSVCLKRLEANGLIERIVATEGQLAVEYKVTTLGHSLESPIAVLMLWSNENVGAIRTARDHRSRRLSARAHRPVIRLAGGKGISLATDEAGRQGAELDKTPNPSMTGR